MNDTLPLAQITVDPTLQPRVAGVDAEHVRALQETPDAWPPLLVVRRDGAYILLDGFHRYAAAQNLGLADVPATVVPFPADGDLATLAFAANLAHGLPLTLADKRAYAERLLTTRPDVSNMEVSRQVALSPTTVAAIRQRLEDATTIAPVEQRIGKGGYSYTVSTESQRVPGTLPPVGIGAHLDNAIGHLFTPVERKQQRGIVQYLQRLLIALNDQYNIAGWESAEGAADACRLVLGEERAVALGLALGETSDEIYAVAQALGYREEPAP